MNRKATHGYVLTLLASLLLFGGAATASADADITNAQAVVEKRVNPTSGREEAWVIILYDITDVPQTGSLLSMEVQLDGKEGSRSFTFVPPAGDISGDYGTITSDGTKRIEWYAERSLVQNNDQGKYDATVTLQLAGNGDPTEAVLHITKYTGTGWKYFNVGTAKLVNLKRTNGFDPVCTPVQGNAWHTTVPGNAVFYKGDLVSFPTYRGRRANDVIKGSPNPGTGCSSFLAVQDIGTPQQKVWALFAQQWNMILTSNNTSFIWEFQARYFESGAGTERALKMGNAGKPDQQQFEELEIGEDFTLELVAGPGEQEESNTFELEVLRRQFKYVYKGSHVMTFSATDDGYFEGSGPNKLKLRNGDMTVNGWLHFSGTFEIDTTTNAASFYAVGAWANAKGSVLWIGPFSATLTTDIVASVGTDPILMGVQWAIAGFSVTFESIKFVGGVDNATGIEMDIRLLIPQFASGCAYENDADPAGFSIGGIKIKGVKVTDDGFEISGVEATNLGAKILPAICMKSFKMDYDRSQKKMDVDLVMSVKPVIDDMGGGVTLLDGKLDGFHLLYKTGSGLPVPIPQPPPGHVAVWKGMDVKVLNMEKGPLTLSGTAFFASREDWKQLPAYQKFAQYVGDAVFFETEGKLEYVYGESTGLNGKVNILGYSHPWLTGGASIWLAQGEVDYKIFAGSGRLSLSAAYTLGLLNLGGDKPVFSGSGKGSLALAPEPNIAASLTGSINLPDLFKDLPAGDYLNKKFGLPKTLNNSSISMNNLQFSASSISSDGEYCVTIDLSKNPLTQPNQFFHLCDAASVLTTRTEQKGATPTSVNDTTWFDFIATSDMKLGVIHVYGTPPPTSVLVDPSGSYRTADATGAGVAYYPPRASGESGLWELTTPQPGAWRIALVDMKETDSIYTWGTYTPRPNFAFTSQSDNKTIIATWGTGSVPENSSIDFYLDTDNKEYDGLFIGSATESAGEFRFELNDSLPDCGYYIYGMRNDNGKITSSYSPTYHTLVKSRLAPPSNIHAVVETNGETTVTWDHSPDEKRLVYIIRISDADGTDSIYTSTGFAFSMATIHVENWQNKILSMKTIGEDGLSGCWSEPISFQVSGVEEEPTAGDRKERNLLVHVQPNPTAASASIFVNLEKHDLLIVELYSVDGRRIETLYVGEHSAGTARAEFDVSDLQSGTYMLRVTTTSGTAVEKLVVRH